MEQDKNEMITMSKRVYQCKIGRAYNRGRIDALHSIGFDTDNISNTTGLSENIVQRHLSKINKTKELA